jgi:hypothetical protein
MPCWRQDVHHARREPAVGHHRAALGPRLGVERLLLEHDLGVAAEVAEVRARVHRGSRHVEVEVVRQRAHARVGLAQQGAHRLAVARVERRRDQARPAALDARGVGVRGEEPRQRVDAQVGEAHLDDGGIL